MKIINVILNIYRHPFNKDAKIKAIFRFLIWQFFSRLTNYTIIYPITHRCKMLVQRGMTGVTGCIYNGLLEFEDMLFMLHFLRETDLFVDIGANVGVYTILASSEIGSKVITIEPINITYNLLKQNILLNNVQEKVTSLNIGIGEKKDKLYFSSTHDTINHVLTDCDINSTIESEYVFVEKLDDILEDRIPILIKIDVEGFETNVINGADKILSNDRLKGIIIELNGSGSKYGFNDNLLHNKILSYGFTCFKYDPYERELIKIENYGKFNTIYIRDIDFIKSRIKDSRKINILDKSI